MQWWRFICGLLIIGLATQIGSIPYYAVMYYQKNKLNLNDQTFNEAIQSLNYSVLQVDQSVALFMILLVFGIALGLTAIFIPKIHKIPLQYFTTQRSSFDWKRGLFAFLLWFILLSILIFLLLPGSAYRLTFEVEHFFIFLLIAILLVPIQAAFEEVLFRGYLFSGVQMATKNNFVTLIITSSLFSLVHAFNPEFEISFWKLFWFYFAAGFSFGMITIIDKGIELAWGAHTAYNIFFMVVLSTSDGILSTPSILQTTSLQLLDVMPYVLFFVVDISVVIFFIKYKWFKEFERTWALEKKG